MSLIDTATQPELTPESSTEGAQPATEQGVSPAGASPAPEGEGQSLIDIAREAVASLPPEDRGDAGSPPAEEGSQTPEVGEPATPEQTPEGAQAPGSEASEQGEAQTGEGDAQGPDDYADLLDSDDVPGKTKRRVRQLLQERAELREQVTTTAERVESFQADAEQYQQIQSFMRESNLSPAETAETLQVAALIKGDPFQAMPVIENILGQLRAATGHNLPPDLQQRVDAGQLAYADALATSQARARASHAEHTTQVQAQQHQADQESSRRSVMSQAVNQWEAQIRTTDPDYEVKRPFILDRLRASLAQGLPADMMAAVTLVNTIHADVTKQLGAIRPAPKVPTQPAPRGERTTTGTRSEPGTLLEAAQQALDAHHAA